VPVSQESTMSNRGPTISLGVGARQLRDRDWLSKSDPYLVISKPSVSGGFHVLRKSETKKNSLNPDWADFLFNENELSQHDLDLRLKVEVFDNDYGSSDQLLGVAHLSLKQLEAAALLQNCLPLGDGKGKNKAGSLVIRSFSRHPGQGGGHPGQFAGSHQTPSYPRPQESQYGYPIPLCSDAIAIGSPSACWEAPRPAPGMLSKLRVQKCQFI